MFETHYMYHTHYWQFEQLIKLYPRSFKLAPLTFPQINRQDSLFDVTSTCKVTHYANWYTIVTYYLACGRPYFTPTPTLGKALITFLSVEWSGKENKTAAEIRSTICRILRTERFFFNFHPLYQLSMLIPTLPLLLNYKAKKVNDDACVLGV